MNLIRPFCEDAKKFLEEDNKNIVAIHCKAGKGMKNSICKIIINNGQQGTGFLCNVNLNDWDVHW